MRRHGPWRALGLDPTEDRGAIRRAYADKLRQLDPDSDVEGYTRLRNARDHALALAQSTVPAEMREPVLADEGRDEWPDEPHPDQATEPLDGSASSLPPDDRTELPQAPQVLLGILFPTGQTSEEPLARDELAAAEQALAAILKQAETSSIDEQAGIENWLAHHLASAWPRSAWLVEEAALAFGWMEESGQLGERPAVHFLNQRLKGMRFVAKVQEPGHALHKAWTELAKPGPKGALAFMRARRGGVRFLLEGIRERYPEVEGHLDPERVASWEGSQEAEPGSAWFTFVILASAAGLLRLCAASVDSSPPPPSPPIQASWSDSQVDELVMELFGERLNDDTLLVEAPEIWDAVQRASSRQGLISHYVDDTSKQLLIALRAQTQLAARDADFGTLIAIKEVKLDLLRIIRDRGDAWDCLRYARQGLFPTNVDVPDALRARERELAARLAREDLLLPSETEFAETASIPGSVIERIMQSTGLPEDAVRRAAGDRGDEGTLCNYRIALLEAVLQRPADVSADLLRMI